MGPFEALDRIAFEALYRKPIFLSPKTSVFENTLAGDDTCNFWELWKGQILARSLPQTQTTRNKWSKWLFRVVSINLNKWISATTLESPSVSGLDWVPSDGRSKAKSHLNNFAGEIDETMSTGPQGAKL